MIVDSTGHTADALQQQHAWLAVPVAVWKKFGDAGLHLASLAHASPLYGTFAVVLGLLAWLHLQGS